jgi:regulatory protein
MRLRVQNRSKRTAEVSIDDITRGIFPKKMLPFFSDDSSAEIEISEHEYQTLKEEIANFAWQKLLNYLSYRERSRHECYNYMKRNKFQPELIENLLIKAEEYNYLNNDRFADMYIEELINKGYSELFIKHKMREKGLEEKQITHLLDEKYKEEAKREIIYRQIKKASGRYSTFPEREKRDKIFKFLFRKGFSYSDIQYFYEEYKKEKA